MVINISVSLDSEKDTDMSTLSKLTAILEGAPTSAPAKEKPAPAKEKPAPAKEKPAPAKEKTAPAKEKPAPAKEKTAPAKAEADVSALTGDELYDKVNALSTTLTKAGAEGAPKNRKAINKFLKEFEVRKMSQLKFNANDPEWTQEDADESLRDVYNFLLTL